MAKFRYKGRGEIRAGGYIFRHDEITVIPDDDAATLRKLRGDPRSKYVHPSFEEVQ